MQTPVLRSTLCSISSRHNAAAVPVAQVVQLLPWLLVTNGRLTTQDITRIATQRALGSLLELGLQMKDAVIVRRGCQTEGMTPPQALMQVAAALQRLYVR